MFQLSFAASDTGGPLYDQLYRAIVAQIRQGELAPGERLPGKRHRPQDRPARPRARAPARRGAGVAV